jgi:prepilin-type N-terminal cleavage/methylation domain-containing protein
MSKGFTFIEVIIAIFILVVVIVGVYNAFSTMVVLTSDITMRFTAAYLAQEGLEIMRNIRDTNWINGRDWRAGLADANTNCENGCQADYKSYNLSDAPYGDTYLKLDSNGFYNNTNGEDTKFKRKIIVKEVNPGGNSNVLYGDVIVTWEEKQKTYSFEAEEYLYNWY